MIAWLERHLASRPLIATFPTVMIALVVMASVAAAGVSYWIANNRNVDRTTLTLRSELNTLQGTIEFLLETGEMQQVQQMMVDVRSDPHFALALVADERLDVAAASQRGKIDRPLFEMLATVDFDAAQSKRIVDSTRSQLTGWMGLSASGDYMLGVYPVNVGGAQVALGQQRIGILAVARDQRRDRSEMMRSVSIGSLFLVALTLLMAAGLGLIGHTVITRRMAHLIATTNLVAAGKLDTRVALKGRDELSRIGKAIDSMADQLQRSQEVSNLSLAHTHRVLETSLDAAVVMDAEGIITLWNAHAESIFGWTAREAVGKRMSDLIIPPQHRAAHIHGLERFLQSGQTVNIGRRIEIEALRKSGESFQVELAISLLPTSTGLCFSAFIRDITARKATEAAITAANRRFQAVVENVQEGITVVQDEFILYANPAMHAMLDYEGQELMGLRLLDVLVPEERESTIELGRRRLTGMEPNAPYEAWMLKKDGHSRVRVIRNVTVMEIDGRPALLGAITDVTEVRRAEQSLKEANEKYRLMVEHPKTGMFIARDLHFLYANPALHEMLGYTPGELSGMDSRLVVAPEYLPGLLDWEVRRKEGIAAPATEIRMLRKGGAGHVFVETFATPVTYNGAPAWLGSVHDITDRKRAETQKELLQRQLLQAQKMEAIGQLTGGIAHDFNNILMSIRGYNSMAITAAAQGNNTQVAEDLLEVQAQVDRASDLVAKLLAFARGKSAGADALDITATIEESFRMLRAVIPSGIELTWNADPGLPPVAMDRVQLQQVLMNLCINARDAQDGKGGIEIRLVSAAGETGVCQSCFQEFAGDFVCLSVCDQGPGIDPALQQRIFEPFFSTKEVGRGSGMGLAMVHGIVHEHGGHILVSANKDRGTTFNLFLPVTAGRIPESLAAVSEIETPAPHPAQIMIVDDEASLGRYLTRLLRGKGYTVHAFDNPAEALQFFNDNMDKVDLLLTDKTMPGMNGLELAESVRSKRPDLPVIIATGYADATHEDEAERLGVYALLKKPASSEQILMAVINALGTTGASERSA